MSKITNYFVQNKNTSIEPQQEKSNTKASDFFYNNCLLECGNLECAKQKENLKVQICEIKEKISKIEDAIESCN